MAMGSKASDAVLKAALTLHSAIATEEKKALEWLLAEQGEANSASESRPVAVMAHDGWLATTEVDPQLRDLEIATVCTQLQSFHLANWLGIQAWLRVLELHDEADVADKLCAELRRLEREIETLRPTLAVLVEVPGNSTTWYRPSNRRSYGNFTTTGLKI
ncbi:MAG: hypothetical protein AB8H79_18255 [Myxococcota bacterium]